VGLSLDQFCSKSPKAPVFDHFLELWVYAKQFTFGGLVKKKKFCSRRRREEAKGKKMKKKEEDDEEEVVSRVL
jgi:hypothetical protein